MDGMPHVTGWDGFLAGVYFFMSVIGFMYGVSLVIKANKEPFCWLVKFFILSI